MCVWYARASAPGTLRIGQRLLPQRMAHYRPHRSIVVITTPTSRNPQRKNPIELDEQLRSVCCCQCWRGRTCLLLQTHKRTADWMNPKLNGMTYAYVQQQYISTLSPTVCAWIAGGIISASNNTMKNYSSRRALIYGMSYRCSRPYQKQNGNTKYEYGSFIYFPLWLHLLHLLLPCAVALATMTNTTPHMSVNYSVSVLQCASAFDCASLSHPLSTM